MSYKPLRQLVSLLHGVSEKMWHSRDPALYNTSPNTSTPKIEQLMMKGKGLPSKWNYTKMAFHLTS